MPVPALLRKLGARSIGNRNVSQSLKELARAGITLPAEYLKYLRATPALGLSARLEHRGRGFLLARLFGGSGRYGVLENHDNAAPRRSYVAIGEDLMGNGFLLAVRGPAPGSVWFWDHETGEVVRLCRNFAELLERLRADIDEDVAPPNPASAQLAVLVPLEQAARLEARFEALGKQLERAGLGELLGFGETDDRPPRYRFLFSSPCGRAALLDFLERELASDRKLTEAVLAEFLIDKKPGRGPELGHWQRLKKKAPARPAARGSSKRR